MDDDDKKGKRFLKLINDQNNLQWNIVSKLSSLITSKWNSTELQKELETLSEEHSIITKELKFTKVKKSGEGGWGMGFQCISYIFITWICNYTKSIQNCFGSHVCFIL